MRSAMTLALMCVLVAGGVVADTAITATVTGPVDINLSNVPVRQAIQSIFEGRGLRYIIEPGVTGKVVEIKFKGVTVAEALKALGDAAGFTYTYEEGVYTISPKTAAVASTPAPRPEPAPKPVLPEPRYVGPVARAQQPSAAPIIVNNYPETSSRAGDLYAYAPYGGWGWGPGYFGGGGYYNTGYYNPFYTIAPPPYMVGNFPPPPPPAGWFSPDVEKVLRFQWAVPRRYGFITPY